MRLRHRRLRLHRRPPDPAARRRGWTVKALARSESSAAKVRDAGAEAVMGDLDDVAAMTEGARGCEYAFHAAAVARRVGPARGLHPGNVNGTTNALMACREAGVRRFVHVGTEAALLVGQPLVNADETRAAAARLEGALQRDEGDGRAGRTRRGRRRLRDRRAPAAARVGSGRHHDPAALKDAVEKGPLLLDRRRQAPHVDDARGQRGRGPRARGDEGQARRTPTS